MAKLNSFRELKVYQKLKALHLEVHRETLRFPKFDECGRMLEGLHQSLSEWAGTTRTGKVVREDRAAYGTEPVELPWLDAASITNTVGEDFPWKA